MGKATKKRLVKGSVGDVWYGRADITWHGGYDRSQLTLNKWGKPVTKKGSAAAGKRFRKNPNKAFLKNAAAKKAKAKAKNN